MDERNPSASGAGKRSRNESAATDSQPKDFKSKGIATFFWVSVAIVIAIAIGGGVLAATRMGGADTNSTAGRMIEPPANRSFELEKPLDWFAIDNAARDGWNVAALAEQLSERLNRVEALLVGSPPDPGLSSQLAMDNYQGSVLVVANSELENISTVGKLQVHESSDLDLDLAYQRPDGFIESCKAFASEFEGARVRFEINEIVESERGLQAAVEFKVARQSDEQCLQSSFNWETEWSIENKELALRRIQLVAAKSLVIEQAYMQDVTEAILGENDSYHRQLVPGYEFWLQRRETAGFD